MADEDIGVSVSHVIRLTCLLLLFIVKDTHLYEQRERNIIKH